MTNQLIDNIVDKMQTDSFSFDDVFNFIRQSQTKIVQLSPEQLDDINHCIGLMSDNPKITKHIISDMNSVVSVLAFTDPEIAYRFLSAARQNEYFEGSLQLHFNARNESPENKLAQLRTRLFSEIRFFSELLSQQSTYAFSRMYKTLKMQS